MSPNNPGWSGKKPLSRAQGERLRDIRSGISFMRGAAGMFTRAHLHRAAAAVDREIAKIIEEAREEGFEP
jgi:hypothetical protein